MCSKIVIPYEFTVLLNAKVDYQKSDFRFQLVDKAEFIAYE